MGMAVIVRLMVRICRRNTIERVTILAPQVPRSLSLSRGNQVIDVFRWVMNSKKITCIKESPLRQVEAMVYLKFSRTSKISSVFRSSLVALCDLSSFGFEVLGTELTVTLNRHDTVSSALVLPDLLVSFVKILHLN